MVLTQSEISVSLGSCYYLSWLALTGLISLCVAVLGNSTSDFSCSWIGFFRLRINTSPGYKKEILGSRARQSQFFLFHSIDCLVSEKNTAQKHLIGIKLSSGQSGTQWRTPPRWVRDISGSLVTTILNMSCVSFQSNISPQTSYSQFSVYNV